MALVSRKKTYLYSGILLCVLILFHWIGWLKPIETGVRSLFTAPLKRVTASVHNPNSAPGAESVSSTAYHQLLAETTMLRAENEQLRQQLDFKKQTNFRIVPANVIGRDATTLGNIIIVDQGETGGIQLKAPVVVDAGVLVGTVIKVTSRTAHILLLNDNQSKIAAAILNRDQSVGVVEGGYGISLRLTLIPRNEVVAVGDQVITSGLDGIIPRGLLIGTIAEVENEAYKPFQQAILSPEHDLNKLTLVGIIASQ